MRTLLCRGQEDLLWAPPPEILDQGLQGALNTLSIDRQLGSHDLHRVVGAGHTPFRRILYLAQGLFHHQFNGPQGARHGPHIPEPMDLNAAGFALLGVVRIRA